MPQITKPNTLNKIWAAGGDRATPLDSKISSGWQIEIPPRQWFNWLDNRQDQAIAHFNQHGIPVWDDQTEYQAGKSYVQDPSNGLVYRCVTTNTGNQPALTPSHWTVAFADAATAFSESQADAKYLVKAQNLNDLPNKTQARTNLGVYSAAQVDTLFNSAIKLTDFTGSGRQNLNATGYQRLPGGLIVQWGIITSLATNPLSLTFPVAFPNRAVYAHSTTYSVGVNASPVGTLSLTNTSVSFRFYASPTITNPSYWIAIGY